MTFAESETVFLDEAALLIADPDHSDDEDRFVLLGLTILTAVYYMLKNGVDFIDLDAEHLTHADRIKTANRLLRKLGDLGFEVTELCDKQAA